MKLSKAELESTDRVKIRLKTPQATGAHAARAAAETNYLVSPTSTVARLLSVVRKDCRLPTDTPRPLHLYAAGAPRPLDLSLTAEELRKNSNNEPVELEVESGAAAPASALLSAAPAPAPAPSLPSSGDLASAAIGCRRAR